MRIFPVQTSCPMIVQDTVGTASGVYQCMKSVGRVKTQWIKIKAAIKEWPQICTSSEGNEMYQDV